MYELGLYVLGYGRRNRYIQHHSYYKKEYNKTSIHLFWRERRYIMISAGNQQLWESDT